jgi:hypothetical protein
LEYFPASQDRHLVLPASDDLPASQSTHVEDPSSSDFVLIAHCVQFVLKVAPGCEFFFPAAHLLHPFKLGTPLAEEYRPDGHVLHETPED